MQFARQPDGTFVNTTVPAFAGARLVVNPDGIPGAGSAEESATESVGKRMLV